MNSSKKTWFAFPYILWIIGFTMIPLGLVLYYAFTSADGGFTLANVLAIAEPVTSAFSRIMPRLRIESIIGHSSYMNREQTCIRCMIH